MSLRLLALLHLLFLAGAGAAEEYPKEKLREEAKPDVLAGWMEDFRTKRDLVPRAPPPRPSAAEAPDFRGRWRCGNYSYVLEIGQSGDQVVFTAGGVDRQDIGGAFDTVGIGVVAGGRIRARWWCLDLTRNVANNGGCEIWFLSPHRLRYRYYHDSDETIEEGYAVREGEHPEETPPYRVRVPQPGKPGPIEIRGTVKGREGEAIPDAVVLQRHEESTAVRTDGSGSFVLRLPKAPAVLLVSAAARGYRNASEAILFQEMRDLHFVLDREPGEEDPDYVFVDPTPEKGREIFRCGNCHRNSYAEWAGSRHAVAATNPVTLAVYARDFLPALESGRAKGDRGLCAACHAPEAALRAPGIGLDEVRGTALRGNHCDLCHKVHHTEDPEAPGVRGSLVVTLPAAGGTPGPIRRVYGPLADSDYLFMGAVYNPFFTTSLLCAGCHQYTTPEGIPALDTYREWLRWASTEAEPKTCQECHMPAGESREGKDPAARICVNALRRPKEQIHHHGFAGREKAPQAALLEVDAALEGGRLTLRSRVTNAGGGHRLPTGSGDKHLLLLVSVKDASGRALPAEEGPRLPDHAGEWAGKPGREFAQVLADDSGATHVPFWRATRVVEETRLEPGKAQETLHVFGAPGPGRLEVEVSLWHRLRFAAHDVAADVEGEGVRPRDLLLASRTLFVEPGR